LLVAIFGGTFDPVHNAHLAAARAARDRMGIDRILLVPAANPPHKTDRRSEPFHHRLRMVELACQGEHGMEASDLEHGKETSYSIHTIERLHRSLRPDDQLFFLIGADAFADLTSWFRWPDVAGLVEFIVVTRPGHRYTAPEGVRVHPLEGVYLEVSSSAIREKLALGIAPGELKPAVLEYIRAHRLYNYGAAALQSGKQVTAQTRE
jgi:nicotinate-nucleotide adenylyltransferase